MCSHSLLTRSNCEHTDTDGVLGLYVGAVHTVADIGSIGVNTNNVIHEFTIIGVWGSTFIFV